MIWHCYEYSHLINYLNDRKFKYVVFYNKWSNFIVLLSFHIHNCLIVPKLASVFRLILWTITVYCKIFWIFVFSVLRKRTRKFPNTCCLVKQITHAFQWYNIKRTSFKIISFTNCLIKQVKQISREVPLNLCLRKYILNIKI